MKKSILFAALTVLVFLFSGCSESVPLQDSEPISQQEITQAEIENTTEPTKSDSSSFSVRNEPTEEKETEPSVTSEQSESILPVTDNTAAEVKSAEQPKVETPAPTVTEETLPPQTTAETEAPKEESAPPPITEPPVPTFNIQTWIDYAACYAEIIGLNVNPDAVSCWDNPITAGAHSTCLERDIESRINRYARDEEITDVWIWAETRSDGSYDLYIGYA